MMMSSTTSSSNGNKNVQYHHHRRGHSFNGIPNLVNSDHLIFSNNTHRHRTLSFASSNHVSQKLWTLFAESEKLATSGFDDLLSSTDGGKHDYDWLLTPPRSPDFPPPRSEPQPILAPTRSCSLGKPTSNVNASTSRVSASQISESKNGQYIYRAGRSSSETRSASNSISTCQNNSSYYSNRSSSSILNTSSASVPSSPITTTRSLPSAARPSTSTSRLPTISSADKARPSQIPRPYILQSPPATAARSISRPCTPTRHHPTLSSSTSAGLGALSKCNSAPKPRSITPSRRRPQPVVPPDFPLETPPNLRTTLPADRPVSAGRSRPTLKASSSCEAQAQASARRQPSPIVNRGRLLESTAKSPRRVPHAPSEVVALARRSLIKPSSSAAATDSNGLGIGRTISKKSLDMAIRHMDIRSNSGTLRSLSSSTLFPQSIRTSAPKAQPRGLRSDPASVYMNGGLQVQSGNNVNDGMKNRREKINERQHFARLSEVDMYEYESCRYDALLLKYEDLKNSDWLHGAQDDKCDQAPIFDNGFESLPEPFGLL